MAGGGVEDLRGDVVGRSDEGVCLLPLPPCSLVQNLESGRAGGIVGDDGVDGVGVCVVSVVRGRRGSNGAVEGVVFVVVSPSETGAETKVGEFDVSVLVYDDVVSEREGLAILALP